MTPRLAVTQEQAEDIASAFAMKRAWAPVTMRLPERPTMPCSREHLQHGKIWSEAGVTPIPEGTRVQVGWWDADEPHMLGTWHPVATATLGSVQATTYQTGRTDNTPDHLVTLTNLRPIGADQ